VAYCSTRKEERAKYKISSSIIVNQNVNISCSNKGYIDGYTVEGRGGGLRQSWLIYVHPQTAVVVGGNPRMPVMPVVARAGTRQSSGTTGTWRCPTTICPFHDGSFTTVPRVRLENYRRRTLTSPTSVRLGRDSVGRSHRLSISSTRMGAGRRATLRGGRLVPT